MVMGDGGVACDESDEVDHRQHDVICTCRVRVDHSNGREFPIFALQRADHRIDRITWDACEAGSLVPSIFLIIKATVSMMMLLEREQ